MRLLTAFIAVTLSSCTGYHLGGVKPRAMANVRSIAVPMCKNDTQHPRANAIATSALAGALVQDGTYRLSSTAKADAILEASIHKIEYLQIRSERLDTLRPEELENVITIQWILRDARNPRKTILSGSNTGTSRFFVDANLQTARNNALPDACERASQAIISRLANGF